MIEYTQTAAENLKPGQVMEMGWVVVVAKPNADGTISIGVARPVAPGSAHLDTNQFYVSRSALVSVTKKSYNPEPVSERAEHKRMIAEQAERIEEIVAFTDVNNTQAVELMDIAASLKVLASTL